MVYRLVINSEQKQDQEIHLLPEQEHYLKRVLRLQEKDRFIAMDGRGNCWIAELNARGGQIIDILLENNELGLAVTLMVALPKGNGFDEILRPVTELGVSELMPIISTRTLLKPSAQKLTRWQKILREASEQAERQLVPSLWQPISFSDALGQTINFQGNKYIAIARYGAPHLLSCLSAASNSTTINSQSILIATGSEGGWTKEEIQEAIAAGFQPVSLGKRILRGITAPIMAMSLVAGVQEARIEL